jgi:hypothetical protein
MQLGIDAALIGSPAQFSTAGGVAGLLPRCKAVSLTQRRRWEHGHLATILTQTPRLLAHAAWNRDLRCLWMALDVAVPPVALLAAAWSCLVAVSAVVMLRHERLWPLLVALGCGAMLITSVLIAWRRFAQDITLLSLCFIPLYVFAKLPIYVGFVVKRNLTWTPTNQHLTAAEAAWPRWEGMERRNVSRGVATMRSQSVS